MTSASTSLTVYLKAERRFYEGTATKIDEVVLALWDEVKEQKKIILELSLKISLLETRNIEQIIITPTYSKLMTKLGASHAVGSVVAARQQQ